MAGTREEYEVLSRGRRIVGPPASSMFVVAATLALIAGGWFAQNFVALRIVEEIQRAGHITTVFRTFNWSLLAWVLGLPSGVMLLAIFTMYGAWQMRRCRSRGWSYAACLLSFLNPLLIVSIPLAIWGLWTLRHPDVKAAFALNARRAGGKRFFASNDAC
jgi:hypothetical protein